MVVLSIMILLLFIASASAADSNDADVISIDDTANIVDEKLALDSQLELNDAEDDLKSIDENQVIEDGFVEDDLKSIDENQVIEDGFVEDNGSFAALQEKIDNAGDNSTVALPNSYLLENGFEENGISINKNLTIDGNGFTINANHGGRILNITGATVTLQNIKFSNGKLEGMGAAIYSKDSNLTIINCNFSNNHATGDNSQGGAVYFNGDKLTIFNSEFIANAADYDGGAVYLKGDYGIINASNFTNNRAYFNGAVYMNSLNGTVEDCIFANNVATNSSGALGWVEKQNGTVFYSQFINNTAPLGGAIYVNEGNNLTVEASKFIKNNASIGGAIYLTGGDGIIANSTFDMNSASEDGGAIYLKGSEGILVDSNFTNNRAKYYGALYMESIKGIMDKCIFANNVATESAGALGWVKEENGTIRASKFINNSAPIGGAIYVNNAKEFYITTSDFVNNTASLNGGAIYWDSGADGSITVSSFINNNATENGGALYFNGTNGKIAYSQFTNNTAASGGAIYNNGSIIAGDIKFTNNTASDGNNDIAGSGSAEYIVNFDIAEEDNVYGKTAKINVNITSNGKPVNGGNVSTVVNNVTYNASVVNGVATLQIPNLKIGIYELWLSYVSNDSSYRNDKDYYELIITKQNIEITAKDAAYIINYGGKYSVTLKDSDGNAVVGEKVTFTFNGKVIGSASTNASGVASISLSASALKSAKAGKKNIAVTLTSDKYNATAKAVKITINKEKTKIISAIGVKTTYNVKKNLVIKLTDSRGNALKGFKITVDLNGAKTYTTNSKGQVIINVAKLVPKTYTAKISFNGNGNYLNSAKSVKVTVKKAAAKMTAKKKTFKRNVKVKKYTITLNNVKKAIKGVKVTLKVNKKTFKAKTNKKGKAVFKIKNLKKKGTYKAVIKFAGNKYYKKVTKKVKIRVKK